MKRLLGTIVSVLLVSSYLAENSYAAIKVNSPCKKEGQKKTNTDNKFICSKSGKKLIWKLIDADKVSNIEPLKTVETNFLNILPPSMGDITTRIECLKEVCVYSGETPQGSIIVIKALKDVWNSYAASNGLTHISFRSTSPSGKVINYSKNPLPYKYDTTAIPTSEIGIWTIQIAGWIGSQQTEWSSPKSVTVSVLPQSAKSPINESTKTKVLPECSSSEKLALTQIARLNLPLAQRYSDAQMELQKLEFDYQLANVARQINALNTLDRKIQEAKMNLDSIGRAMDRLSSQRSDILKKCDPEAQPGNTSSANLQKCTQTQISLMKSLRNQYWNLMRQVDSYRSEISRLQNSISAFTPPAEVARINFAIEDQSRYLDQPLTQASLVEKQFKTANSSCLNSGISLD